LFLPNVNVKPDFQKAHYLRKSFLATPTCPDNT